MTHEREQSHAASSQDSSPNREDSEPGRSSRSALMRKPDQAIVSGLLSRKARDANGVAEGADSAVAAASSSSGSALPENLQRKFESSLGADLSGVRVHTGDSSAAANDAVGAKAYTMGNDIHFGAGHYDPSSADGEHLLAHEVAHTVQQSGGAQRMQFKLEVSSPGDHLEVEADRAADAMVSGTSATVFGASGLSRKIQREPAAPKVGNEAKFTFASKELPLGGKKTLGPFEMKPTVSFEVEAGVAKGEPPKPGDGGFGVGKKKEEKEEGGGLKVGSGGVGGPTKGVGLQGEVEKKFKSKFLGWDTAIKSEGTFTNKGVDFSVGFTLSHAFGPVEVEAAPIKITLVKWEKGKQPEILALTPSLKVKGTGLHYTADDGRTVSMSLTGVIALDTGITAESFAKWIAKKYGAQFLATLMETGLEGLLGASAQLAVAFAGPALAFSVGALSVIAAAQASGRGKFNAQIWAGAKDTKRAAAAYALIMSGSVNTDFAFLGADPQTAAVAGGRQRAAEKRAHEDFANLAAIRGVTVEQLRVEIKKEDGAYGRILKEAQSTAYPAYLGDTRAAVKAWQANPTYVESYFVTEAVEAREMEKSVLSIYNDGTM